MKILFLTQYFPPEVGAAASRSYDYLQELRKGGHEIVVISETPHYPSAQVDEKYKGSFFFKETYHSLPVIRSFVFVSGRKNFYQRAMLYLSFMISSVFSARFAGKVDVVVATSPPPTVGLAGWMISRLKRSKFVVDIRDLWPESALALGEMKPGLLANILKKIELFLYRKADRITIAVPGFRKYIMNLGISKEKIEDLPNGANLDMFSGKQQYATEIRKRHGWDGKFVVLFSGNLGLAQGLNYILATANQMRAHHNILFVFIGDGVEKQGVQKKAREMDLKNVLFLEKQSREKMPQFISAADVCLVPLIKHRLFLNALPSKMFEYMACEKPILVAIDGEAKMLIQKSEAGIFVEPENVPKMKEAILELYHNREMMLTMGFKGRKYVEQYYCRKKLAKKFENILRRCIYEKKIE